MTSLLLIRHAAAQIARDQARTAWPLSPRGHEQAAALANTLRDESIDAIYSSPYARALETVTPLARARGLEVCVDDALGERVVSDGYVEDWDGVMARSWADFDFRTEGGESNRECQVRIGRALAALARQHRRQTVAVGTHGIVLALFLQSFSEFDYAAWREMPEPALYRVEWLEDSGLFALSGASEEGAD
ncbi:MAG: histidine phosphatase family protein [Pseudomonadota bacterium]